MNNVVEIRTVNGTNPYVSEAQQELQRRAANLMQKELRQSTRERTHWRVYILAWVVYGLVVALTLLGR